MSGPWRQVADSFDHNVEAVLRLLTFDRDIIDIAGGVLQYVEAELEKKHLNSLMTAVANRAKVLANVAHHESLKPQYDAMFNQCVVLLVSYFGSGLHRMFSVSVTEALRRDLAVPVRDEKLTVSWGSLATGEDRESAFTDLLVAQKEISFQDMKSIGRAFGDLLSVSVGRGTTTDNIILGQAARHTIVHGAAIIDGRMINQLAGVKARTLKMDLSAGQPLRFDPDEVRILASCMREYVHALCTALDERLGSALR